MIYYMHSKSESDFNYRTEKGKAKLADIKEQ